MTQEQKAKAYDEAIEKLREELAPKDGREIRGLGKKDIEEIFPVLKESEDEKVKREIIGAVEFYKDFTQDKKEQIYTWLKKQSKSTNEIHYWTEEEIEPIISDYLRGAEHYGGMIGRLRCLKPKSLEKQGEQKPIDKIQLGKKYKCIASPRYTAFMIGEIYKPEDKFVCSLMNFCCHCFEPIEDGEQKPTEWSEEDERIRQCLIRDQEKALDDVRNDKYGHSEIISDLKEMYRERLNWLKSLKPQPKQDWSKEDKKKLNRIYQLIAEAADEHAFSTTCRLIGDKECVELQDFLKSLKPQPKQEWSEEDERTYVELVKYFESLLNCLATEERHNENRRWLNWLKSLKDREQPQWKPSMEQMEALRIAGEIGTANNSWAMLTLERMYQHLKKLTE